VGHHVFDIVLEAHLEHLVRLIENKHVNGSKVHRSPAHVIHEPTRRRHDSVYALPQSPELTLDGLAAVDRDQSHSPMSADVAEMLTNLYGQLASRRKDDRLQRTCIHPQAFHEWNTVSGRFAGPCERLRHNVTPLNQRGDDARLDRGRLLEAHLLEAAPNLVTQV
jgi:hypothetical protein